jgi:hypothetical protein
MRTGIPVLSALRGRRGVALPVALIGLVAVSLLVTTMMLTGSTEFAIGSAHRQASASLFDADRALEEYVAQQVVAAPTNWLEATAVGEPATVLLQPGNVSYGVTVARLSWSDNVANNTTGNLVADETYSLLAQPTDGRGRTVGAFVNLRREAAGLTTSLNAGATSGGDLRVSGNATISDGRSGTNYCQADDNQSDYAVQVTAGSKITQSGNSTFEGAADTADFTKEQMADVLLGGRTLDEIAEMAEIKFGTRWNQPAFQTTTITSNSGTNPRYNWGCPAQLGASCPTGVSPDSSTNRFVVVAIDAGGGTVKINGRYGQGMIVVVNGSLEIQGNFIYKGIILVEKDMNVRGGSAGQESKIEGGIVAFGQSSTVEDNITGTATIKYNICAIRDAERALNNSTLQGIRPARQGGSFAWYELIR